MYHYHNTCRSSAANTTHPVLSHLNHPCIHSPQSPILAFCTFHPFSPAPGDVGAWVIPLACRMFSYSCTVWVSLPHILLGPYSFPNRLQSFFSLPSNILPILVVFIIRSRSFLLLVRHTNSSLRNLHTFELSPPIPSSPSRLVNHLPFHNRSAQHPVYISCYFILSILLYHCFIRPPLPRPSVVRTRSGHPKLALSSVDRLVLPAASRE